MAKFRIPKSYTKGFEYFIGLSDGVRENFINEFQKLSLGNTPQDNARHLSTNINIIYEQAEAIVDMVVSLFRAKENSDLDIENFVNGIIEALQELKSEKIQTNENFKKHLSNLLNSNNPFYITYKSISLTSSREKILFSTRILTDLRPVFNDEKSCDLKASLIVHNLKVEFKENDGIKEMYFALNNFDLNKLKNDIERAAEKEKLIRQKFGIKDIPFLDIKP